MLEDVHHRDDVGEAIGQAGILERGRANVEPVELAGKLGPNRRRLHPNQRPGHIACLAQKEAAMRANVEQGAARLRPAEDAKLLLVVWIAIMRRLAA